MPKNLLPAALLMLALGACSQTECPEATDGIDRRAYNLGIIGGFSEVVRLGVKQLALSEVLIPEEMDDLLADAEVVADRNEVLLYREEDFLVTDLYPADVAEGKHLLLIYTGDTLDQYQKIKSDKAELIKTDQYHGPARAEIARRFGHLLSYPDEVIVGLMINNAGT